MWSKGLILVQFRQKCPLFKLYLSPYPSKKKKEEIYGRVYTAYIFLYINLANLAPVVINFHRLIMEENIQLNMCFECSKQPSHCESDGSFEHPQHMFWMRGKKKKIFNYSALQKFKQNYKQKFSVKSGKYFYLYLLAYVLDAQKNCLIETVFLSICCG